MKGKAILIKIIDFESDLEFVNKSDEFEADAVYAEPIDLEELCDIISGLIEDSEMKLAKKKVKK